VVSSVGLKRLNLLRYSSSSMAGMSSLGCVISFPRYLVLKLVISALTVGIWRSGCKIDTECLNLRYVRNYSLKTRSHIPENTNLNRQHGVSILCEDKCVHLLHIFKVTASVRNRTSYPIELCHYLFYLSIFPFLSSLYISSPRDFEVFALQQCLTKWNSRGKEYPC